MFRVFLDVLPCSQIDIDIHLTTRQYIIEDSEQLTDSKLIEIFKSKIQCKFLLRCNAEIYAHHHSAMKSYVAVDNSQWMN
jgi:hypothetical protein